MTQQAKQAIDPTVEFAKTLGRGLVGLNPADFAEGVLTLPFGLSAWMRQTQVSLEEARVAISLLRDVLLDVSGLHRATEPVPLLARDRQAAVVSMTVYLEGLLTRAAAQAHATRSEVVEAALEALSS
ncbi:MAG: hypothetical protein ABSD78_14190 [Acidimicrobiales bacterium]